MRRRQIRLGAVAGALALLTACGDGGHAMRTAALETISIVRTELNRAGKDPIQLEPERLSQVATACSIATTLVTVWRPDTPSIDAEGEAWCAEIVTAAGRAEDG